MRAGRLRHRIYIEEPTGSASSSRGQVTSTWTIMAHPWAEITPIAQVERHVAQQLRTTTTHTISMRWLEGVTTEHRVRYLATPGSTERIFAIRGVIDPDERRRRLVLDVEEQA